MLIDLILNVFVQTKTAKSMVGLSLSVDSSQLLSAAEYRERRGIHLLNLCALMIQISFFQPSIFFPCTWYLYVGQLM